MSVLTPDILAQIDHNISYLAEEAYLNKSTTLWWDKVAKVRNSASKVEHLVWLLGTAKIERLDSEGAMVFEDMVELTHSAENEFAGGALEIFKSELVDLDGKGLSRGAAWGRRMGSMMAYFPQQELAKFIKLGESTTTAYDGQPFFSASHPLNPFQAGLGNFSNLLTGGSAKPINGALDTAYNNLADAIATAESILSADGETPRGLEVTGILVPPQLKSRAEILTQGRFLPQANGTADVSPAGFAGIGVYSARELAADASSYYLITSAVDDTEMSAFVYQEREPFSISNHDEISDYEIRKSQKFSWVCRGRNTLVSGHPFGLIKVKAS